MMNEPEILQVENRALRSLVSVDDAIIKRYQGQLEKAKEEIERLKRDLDSATKAAERYLWNLAGCNTYAEGAALDKGHNISMELPALAAVRRLALRERELRVENKILHMDAVADRHGSKHYVARIATLTDENERLKKLKHQGLPNCPQCKGCGWTIDSEDGGATVLCDCVGALVIKRLKECNPNAAHASKLIDAVGEWMKATGKRANRKMSAAWTEYRYAVRGNH